LCEKTRLATVQMYTCASMNIPSEERHEARMRTMRYALR
jgi:hypothetical protein